MWAELEDGVEKVELLGGALHHQILHQVHAGQRAPRTLVTQSSSSDVEFKKKLFAWSERNKMPVVKKMYGTSSGTISSCKNQCFWFVMYWYGSGSAFLYHWMTGPDQDPALFFIGFQDSNKYKFFFPKFFLLITKTTSFYGVIKL